MRTATGAAGRPGAHDRHRTSRHRRRRLTDAQRAAATAIGIGATALAVALIELEPTGSRLVDGAYRAAIMALSVAAAARARRRVLLIAAGLVLVGSSGWMLLVAGSALLLTMGLAWTGRRDRVAGCAVGALIAWSAMELSWPASPEGATALLAAAALLPLWYSGYRVLRRRTRHRIRWGTAVLGATILTGILIGAALGATQRTALREAAESTLDAVGVITSGAGDTTGEDFTANEQEFRQVASTTGAWWVAPAMLVPGVAQNVRAVHVAAQSGAALNGVAADLAGRVDYDALALPDGSLDLGRLASYESTATAAAAAVSTAQSGLEGVRSPWLAAPVAEQLDEFLGHLADGEAATTVAAEAAQHLPALLGAEGPRRYLLLLGSPSEARDLGGHVGSWAELMAVDGKLSTVRVGDAYELFGPASQTRPRLTDEDGLPLSLLEMDPTRFPQNWGSSPDLDAVRRLAADLYPQVAGGPPLDGVFYADPTAFAALLELTGPVTEGGRTIDSANAVQFLTRDQYLGPQADVSVTPLIRAALQRFTDSQLPGPSRLAAVFGPAVDAGHLQLSVGDESAGPLLRSTGLDQRFIPPDGGDVVAVVTRNANPSKIDAYLQRRITYEVDWTPASGEVRARLVVTLRNDAPANGLPPLVTGAEFGAPPGTNRTELSLLTPLEVTSASVGEDGRSLARLPDVLGLTRHSLVVEVPPGAERTVTLDLRGSVDAGRAYRLLWYNQPLANRDESTVRIRTDGVDDGPATDRQIRVGPRRVERMVRAAPPGQ